MEYRRNMLKELSDKARAYRQEMLRSAISAGNRQEVERWTLIRINQILKMWYAERSGATEFRTFQQWSSAGYHVERGSKAFAVWGKKRIGVMPQPPVDGDGDGEPHEVEFDFFPITYLFSDRQVKPKDDRHENTGTGTGEAGAAAATAETGTGTGTGTGSAASDSESSRFERAFTA